MPSIVELEHSHTQSFICSLWILHATGANLSSYRDPIAQKAQIVTI